MSVLANNCRRIFALFGSPVSNHRPACNRSEVLSCASVIALVVAMTIGAPRAADAQDAQGAQQSSSPALETITVTARKRAEDVQDVPASITALGPQALENANATSLSEIGGLAPNVYFEKVDPTIPFLYIRGIGSRNFDPGTDEPNGVFIDGVYQAQRGSFDADLFDVDQVAVLRGPQGTLYGKNTIGGAIAVTTKDPSDEFTARFMTDAGIGATPGSWLYDVGGAVSGPITQGVAGTFSIIQRDNNGWSPFRESDISERGGSNLDTVAHGKLVFDFGSSVFLKLNASYTDQDAAPLAYSNNTFGGTEPPLPLAPGIAQPTFSSNPYMLDAYYSGIVRNRIPSASASLIWDLPGITLTSISALSAEHMYYFWDQSGEALPVFASSLGESDHQYSEELRANGSAGSVFRDSDAFTWLFGVFAEREIVHRFDSNFWQVDSLFAYLNGTPFTSVVNMNKFTTSSAAFGQFDYDVTDQLILTLGGRYSHDQSTVDYRQTNSSANGFAQAFATPYQLTLPSRIWTSFDPTATLKYKFSHEVMAYATYASGYKSGAFQYAAGSPAIASVVANPEHVKSYEVGVKTTFLDGRLQLNVDGFHMNYTDLQVLTFVALNGGAIEPATSNAATSTINGAEFEGKWVLDENWRVGLNYSYLHAVYDTYFSPNGNANGTLNFSGNTLPFSPRHTAYLTLDYQKQLSFGHFDADVGYNWRDALFQTPDDNKEYPGSSESPLGLLDAKLALTRGHFKYSFWGTNLTDRRYRELVIDVTGLAQRQMYAAPRTVGVRLDYKY
jgi:iron complex outermembrane recepter protein